jgi:hypothetical protein
MTFSICGTHIDNLILIRDSDSQASQARFQRNFFQHVYYIAIVLSDLFGRFVCRVVDFDATSARV